MTIEEKMKNTSTKDFAKELFDFATGFYTENIDGLCNKCNECNHDCVNGIEKWLNTKID